MFKNGQYFSTSKFGRYAPKEFGDNDGRVLFRHLANPMAAIVNEPSPQHDPAARRAQKEARKLRRRRKKLRGYFIG